MNSFSSYSSIFNLGHKAVRELLTVPVIVEEKVDGSQFSFGLIESAQGAGPADPYPYLELRIRSKGAEMLIDAPEKMFSKAAETVKSRSAELHPGWTYRAEYLAKPKHNALVYDRIPKDHLIIFDINTGLHEFLSYEDKAKEAERLGFEVVPKLFEGVLREIEEFRSFLDTTSCLGGQKIEGVVVKPRDYNLYGLDKKVLMGKFVSEAFKEVHRKAWGESNPAGKDVITNITTALNTQARWQKALQHLRERGEIQDSVKDIGALMREIPEDIKKEEEAQIKEWLFAWAWPHIRRGVARGCPEWYKDLLLRKQFEEDPASVPAFLEAKLND